MTKAQHFLYNVGHPAFSSHIDAVHAESPQSDKFTGPITNAVIQKINASGIIATISRKVMDVNRPRDPENAPAIDEYRKIIRNIIDSKKILDNDAKLTRPYLHLALHGMRDDRKADFIIGTCHGESCTQDVAEWFLKELSQLSSKIRVNEVFPGNESKAYHRNGDPSTNYPGYGEFFNTIQIEISQTLRAKKQGLLTNFFSQNIVRFDQVFR